jgi:hypothetical protein
MCVRRQWPQEIVLDNDDDTAAAGAEMHNRGTKSYALIRTNSAAEE